MMFNLSQLLYSSQLSESPNVLALVYCDNLWSIRPHGQGHVSMNSSSDSAQSQTIQDEIADLEKRLRDARIRLDTVSNGNQASLSPPYKLLSSDGRAPSLPRHNSLTVKRISCCLLSSFSVPPRRFCIASRFIRLQQWLRILSRAYQTSTFVSTLS